MIQCQKPKLVEASTQRRQELIEEIEGLAKKGLEIALILAKLGDEDSLARLVADSQLAIVRGKNLLRALYADEDEN